MSLFGQPAGGAQPAPPGLKRSNAFFAPSTAATASAPAGPSMFGATPGQPAQSAAPMGGLFGAPATSAQPAASGLFGQPQPTATPGFGAPASQPTQPAGGLFGAPATGATAMPAFGAQPAAASSGLFGQPSASAAPTGGLFGQPAAAPQQPGLFGAPQAKPATAMGGLGMFGPQAGQPQAQQQMFGPGGPAHMQQLAQQQQGQPQFISTLEAAQRATPLKELRAQDLTLPLSNQYQKKTTAAITQIPGCQHVQPMAQQINKHLTEQERDLNEIQKAMEELKKETLGLTSDISVVAGQTQSQCQKVSQIRLQIEAMEFDLHKNHGYHTQLSHIIDQYNDPATKIPVPFQFFYDLYREQEREVMKLTTKVKEAENLASKLLQDSEKKKKDNDRGHLIDCDLEQVSLRDKIFQVCSMLYEHQQQAGLNLAILESKVSAVRKDFTEVILRKRPWETQDNINYLFEKSEGLQMNNQLSNLNKRTFDNKLATSFEGSMSLGGAAAKSKVSPAPVLGAASKPKSATPGQSLTERLHRGTQASIRMGRRQVGASHREEVRAYEPPLHASASLGKRTFGQQMTHQDEFGYGATPGRSSTIYGGETPGVAARRFRKDGDNFYQPQASQLSMQRQSSFMPLSRQQQPSIYGKQFMTDRPSYYGAGDSFNTSATSMRPQLRPQQSMQQYRNPLF